LFCKRSYIESSVSWWGHGSPSIPGPRQRQPVVKKENGSLEIQYLQKRNKR
jgi:hypothetical protein